MAHQKVVKDSKVLNILLEWQYNLWMKWFINIKYKSTLMIIHYLSITLMFFVNKLLYLLIKLRWKVTIWQHKLKLIFTTIVSQKIAHLTYKYNSDPTAWITKGCMKWKIWKIQIILPKNLERPYMQGMCELQSWTVSCKSVTGGKTQHVHIKPVQKGYKIYHYNLEIPAYHYLERKN